MGNANALADGEGNNTGAECAQSRVCVAVHISDQQRLCFRTRPQCDAKGVLSLNISECYLTPMSSTDSLESFGSPGTSALVNLRIHSSPISPILNSSRSILSSVILLVKTCWTLRELSIASCSLSANDLNSLLEALEQSPCVLRLSLDYVHVKASEIVNSLSTFIRASSFAIRQGWKCQSISLKGIRIDSASAFTSIMSVLSFVPHVDLRHSIVQSETVCLLECISEALPRIGDGFPLQSVHFSIPSSREILAKCLGASLGESLEILSTEQGMSTDTEIQHRDLVACRFQLRTASNSLLRQLDWVLSGLCPACDSVVERVIPSPCTKPRLEWINKRTSEPLTSTPFCIQTTVPEHCGIISNPDVCDAAVVFRSCPSDGIFVSHHLPVVRANLPLRSTYHQFVELDKVNILNPSHSTSSSIQLNRVMWSSKRTTNPRYNDVLLSSF